MAVTLRWGAAVAGLLLLTRLAGCGGSDDELASLEFLLAEQEATCEAMVCTHEGEEVPTVPVYARSIESREASRFAPDGLFVLASWESEERWVEIELDFPTDRVGYVDHEFRYAEYVNGEEVFRAAETRGRVVLVEPLEGDLPFIGHLELRMESSEGEFRVIHRGHLIPDDEEAVDDPGPPDDPIDWERPGIELMIFESAPGAEYESPPLEGDLYVYDYRAGVDPYADLVDAGCQACTDVYYYEDRYYGDSEYYEEETSGCEGGSSSCEGDSTYDSTSDTYYYDDSSAGGCSGDSGESWCQGDSTDDVWDDDSEADGCSCESDDDDYYSDDGDSFCEGDDETSACEGDDYSYSDTYSDDTYTSSEADCGGCEGDDEYTGSTGARHRRELRMMARGYRPRHPLQRGLSFAPILFAFVFTRLLRSPGKGARS